MDDEAASPLPVNAPVLCRRCRYDLRGTASPVCPECGAPKLCTKLAFFNNDEFDEAARVLEEAGIYAWCVNSHSGHPGVISFYTGQTNRPEIWFGQQDIKKVFAMLDDAGVSTPLPIVDRTEPVCPTCSGELDPDGEASCQHCGLPFQWIDIEEPELDPAGRRCSDCGYDLTANTSKHCPECNSPILADLDALVAAATAGEQDDREEPSLNVGSVLHDVGHAIFVGWEILMFVVVGLCGLAWIGGSNIPKPILAGGIAVCLLGGYVGWRWLAARRRSN